MRHYRTEHNPIFWKKRRSRFCRNCSDLIDLMQAESSPYLIIIICYYNILYVIQYSGDVGKICCQNGKLLPAATKLWPR